MTKYNSEDEKRCEFYQILDSIWNTLKESPLHHDNQCPIHGGPHARSNRSSSTSE